MIHYSFTIPFLIFSQLIPDKLSSHTGSLIQSLLISSTEASCSAVSQSQSSFLSHISHLTSLPSLRAHVYITLGRSRDQFWPIKLFLYMCIVGKLCLVDEELSKSTLLLMVTDLEHSVHESVRNNILVVICDLLIRLVNCSCIGVNGHLCFYFYFGTEAIAL